MSAAAFKPGDRVLVPIPGLQISTGIVLAIVRGKVQVRPDHATWAHLYQPKRVRLLPIDLRAGDLP